MKQIIHKTTSVFMAIVVLFTTMSFTVDMHYCGDTMVDYSFMQQVESCGMEKEIEIVTSSCENPTFSKKACCTDKQFIKEGSEDLKFSADQLTFEQQTFVATFFYSYNSLFEGTESKEIPFIDYPPPFVKRDVQVLHQTFLI
jgi:hypothetical protein